jgi:hypothetical protein
MMAIRANWDAVAAVAASVAAIIAIAGLWQSTIDSNKRLAISLLKDFSDIHARLIQSDIPQIRDNALRKYKDNITLSPEEGDYISLVHSLEFIAMAYFRGGVDKKTVDLFLSGFLKGQDSISVDFLEKIQQITNDDQAGVWSVKLIRRYDRQRSSLRSKANARLSRVQSIFKHWTTSAHRARRARLHQESNSPPRPKTSKP